jgi:uncharacterized protein (DUF433 family)
MTRQDTGLDKGIYTFSEVAKLLRVPYHRVYRWFRGVPGRSRKVINSELPKSRPHTISFLDLMEARIALALLAMGHTLSRVRRVRGALARSLGPHPFCRSRLRANEFEILVEKLTPKGDRKLVDPDARQSISSLLQPLLQDVRTDPETDLVMEWRPRPDVVISPKYSFGAPVTSRTRVPTYVLYDSWKANDEDPVLVAEWYELQPEEVRAAVEFEREFRKAA